MRIIGVLIAIAIGIAIGYALWHHGGGGGGGACGPKEVNVVVDSTYKYHLGANQKTRHLSLSGHDFVVWTFDQDSTVDSVTAVFTGATPFASSRFEFADSAAFSGVPIVTSSATLYHYTITVYPHSAAADTVDPGVIVDM